MSSSFSVLQGHRAFDASDVSRWLFIHRNGGTERKVSDDRGSNIFFTFLLSHSFNLFLTS